jgi:hypothetical protein
MQIRLILQILLTYEGKYARPDKAWEELHASAFKQAWESGHLPSDKLN